MFDAKKSWHMETSVYERWCKFKQAYLVTGKFLSLVLSEPKTDMEKRAYSQFVHFVNKVDNLSGTVYTAL